MGDNRVLVNLSLLTENELMIIKLSLRRDNSPELQRFADRVDQEWFRRRKHRELSGEG